MSQDVAQGAKWHYKMREDDLRVGELDIDPRVQRAYLNEYRVQAMFRNWREAACGRIHVSIRKDRSMRVLDGWHRLTTKRRLTDNKGTIPAFVYEGLTLEQEAELFLLLNAGEKPTTIDRYKVEVVMGEDTEAAKVDAILHARGWVVSNVAGTGNLSCVMALRNLLRRSEAKEIQPNLLDVALMIIGRAWGNEYAAGQAQIISGIGRFYEEYRDRIDVDTLVSRLKDYKGGPRGLTGEARQVAAVRSVKMAMAVADLITDEYNRYRGETNRLPRWSKRS